VIKIKNKKVLKNQDFFHKKSAERAEERVIKKKLTDIGYKIQKIKELEKELTTLQKEEEESLLKAKKICQKNKTSFWKEQKIFETISKDTTVDLLKIAKQISKKSYLLTRMEKKAHKDQKDILDAMKKAAETLNLLQIEPLQEKMKSLEKELEDSLEELGEDISDMKEIL